MTSITGVERARGALAEERKGDRVNVGGAERALSAVAGAVAAVAGLRRGTLGGLGLAATGGALLYRGATGHCAAYERLGVSTAARGEGARAGALAERGIRVACAVTIARPPEDVYRAWRNLESLPRFMTYVRSVEEKSERRSHWVADAPSGTVQWDAEIVEDRPGERIAWRSLPGADVDNEGAVELRPAPGMRGTEVRVRLSYRPPAGAAGALVARVLGRDPAAEIEEDLRHLKQALECGETPRTDGQPRGTCE